MIKRYEQPDHGFSGDGHPLKFIDKKMHVDLLIYPILKWLWANHFRTEYSCQGGLRPTEVIMDDNGDVLCDKNGEALKFVYEAYILFHSGRAAAWFYRFLVNNGFKAGFSRREYRFGGGASVRFNHSDIDAIIKELENLRDFSYMEEVVNGRVPERTP